MDDGGPPQNPNIEARVAKLESDVAHIRGDVGEIKAALNRLAPLIDEFHGFIRATLPNLVTRVELAELRTELKSGMAELRLAIVQRPTRRQAVFDIFAIVGLIGAVIAIAEHLAH